MFPFSVLAHPTSDIKHPTLQLRTANGTLFIFGKIPEGLQRTVNENKRKISKVDGIFLTGELDWESVGGVPGMILTISDQGKKKLSLFYGNEYLHYVISTWRSFVFRFGMDITSHILPHQKSFSNDVMEVKSFVLTREGDHVPPFGPQEASIFKKLKEMVTKMFPLDVKNTYSEEENNNLEQSSDPKLSDPYIHVKLPKVNPVKVSTCYSIRLNKVRGKFSVEKAIELGVPKGPIRGKLTAGQEITLKDGTVIKPSQVMSETRQFEDVLIIDLPHASYLKSAKSQSWSEKAAIVYHFLGESVEPFNDEYIAFIESFGDDCVHYVSHPLYCPNSINFKTSADFTLKLKALQPDHFNLARNSNALKIKPETAPNNITILHQDQITTIDSSIPTEKNLIKLDESEVSLRFSADWEQVYEDEVVPLDFQPSYPKEVILDEKSVCATDINKSASLKDQAETITFGTGSALPSKYRNVISTLVRLPFVNQDGSAVWKSVLLDAGENTIGTMYRTLGSENIGAFFQELKMIYLSHLHADHHLGIISIIKEWMRHNKDNDEKLYLVTPWQYNTFVEEWFRFDPIFESLDRISYISCEEFLVGKKRYEIKPIPFENFMNETIEAKEYQKPNRNRQRVDQLYKDLGITKFSTCRAIHCDWSYCNSITFKLSTKEEFKVSYSGDTRPNLYMFAEVIGQGSDLLIHEATLENDLLEEAKKKRHSTINEAIEVANTMNAEKLILTHFSQRYPKLPSISKGMVINSRYCFAFDTMINKFGQIGDQERLIDQLNKAFLEEKSKVENENENEIL
jgi:ribonuclease Z